MIFYILTFDGSRYFSTRDDSRQGSLGFQGKEDDGGVEELQGASDLFNNSDVGEVFTLQCSSTEHFCIFIHPNATLRQPECHKS